VELKKKLQHFAAGAGILILILDSNTAIEGARSGIDLCIRTIIPSLFPFLFLSNYLLHSIPGRQGKMSRFIYDYFNIPESALPVIISGFLGGYPAGAQLISSCHNSEKLKKEDAEYLLHFCSNAGPSFLFGIISHCFPGLHYVWMLWIIHIISAMLTSLVFFKITSNASNVSSEQKNSLPSTLNHTVRSMVYVCGWIILFKVMINFLNKWFFCFFPKASVVLFCGLLELSNGCILLTEITDINIRFVICSVLLAFGGLCVTMQTASLIGTLSLRSYLLGKLTQTFFSTLISIGIVYHCYPIIAPILVASIFILHRVQKNSSFYEPLRV